MILEAASEQAQSQTKQAQITAILAVKPLHPIIPQRTHAQIDDPQIGQARRDQQTTEPFGVAQMAFVDMEPTTFLVGEEGFDMHSLFVHLQRHIQVAHSRDQIERLLVLLLPDSQNTDRTVLLSGHPGRCDRNHLATWRPQIAQRELNATGADADVGGRAADVVPHSATKVGLQCRPVKLAVAQEDHRRTRWHDLLDLRKQLAVGLLRKMAFGPAHDYPAEWQGAPVVDDTQHQGNATTPNHTAIHHQQDRLVCQPSEQLLRDRQKPAIDGLAVVFEEAAKTLDDTLLLCTITGRVVGDGGQVRVFTARQSTDQGHQRIESLSGNSD